MPLASKLPPPGVDGCTSMEEYHSLQAQTQQQLEEQKAVNDKDEKDSRYEDNEGCVGSDLEGSILDRPRLLKKAKAIPPAIPQRNEKRASRMLDNMLLELTSLDGSTTKDTQTSMIAEEDPHEMYLSSEEDASLSDDYEDSLLDVDMEDSNENEGGSASRPSSRKLQEDTARIVSFIMVGKPQIVEILLHSPTSSHNHQLADLDSLASFNTKPSKPRSHRPSPLKLFPLQSDRRMSIASIASTSTTSTASSHPAPPAATTHSTSYISSRPTVSQTTTSSPLPPRKSSRLAGPLASLKSSLHSHSRTNTAQSLSLHTNPVATASHTALPTQQHAFLNMDPFEAAHDQFPRTADEPPPKTPTGMTSSAWKMMGAKGREGVMRSLSKARKGSMPKLNMAYTAGALGSRHQSNDSKASLALPTTSTEEEQSRDEPRVLQRRSATMPMQLLQNEEAQKGAGKGKYEDMLKKVAMKTQSSPSSSGYENMSSKRALMMGLGRRKSVKA